MLKQTTRSALVTSAALLIMGNAGFGEDVIGLGAAPQPQGRLSLDEAQRIALKQNPEVLQAALEVNKSTAHLKSIIAQRYPQILAIAFEGQQVNSVAGKYLENLAVLPAVFQPLTQQYRLSLQVREAGFLVQISQQRLRLAKQQTIAEVKKTYLEMLALQSSIISLKENLKFLHELERFEQSEVRRGAALQVDQMLVQARVARADFEVDRSIDDLNTLGQTLNRMLGRAPRNEVVLIDEAVNPYVEINEQQRLIAHLCNVPNLMKLNSISTARTWKNELSYLDIFQT